MTFIFLQCLNGRTGLFKAQNKSISNVFRMQYIEWTYLSFRAVHGAAGLLHHLFQDQCLLSPRVDPLSVLLSGGTHVDRVNDEERGAGRKEGRSLEDRIRE